MATWRLVEAPTDVMVAVEAHMVEAGEEMEEAIDHRAAEAVAVTSAVAGVVAVGTLVEAAVVVAVNSAAADVVAVGTLVDVAVAAAVAVVAEGRQGRGTRSRATGRAVSRLRRMPSSPCPPALKPTRKPRRW